MSRSDIENDIRQTLGQIPAFFESMPDSALENSWNDFKEFQLQDSALTVREKQLIGYAVAAAIHCPYCTYFHESATTMMGSTSEQLEEANRMAADTSRYSSYLHGLQADISEFKRQTDEIGQYLGEQASKAA